MPIQFPSSRMRRLRANQAIRDLVRETELNPRDFIYPLFITHGRDQKNPIASMPGVFQLSVDKLREEIKSITSLSIPAVILFGLPEHKDATGSDSYSDHGIMQTAIKEIKEIAPELLVISDICFCEYTDHGHCGFVTKKNQQWQLDNDRTLDLLVKQAISHAQAGSDMMAPSGMIDGMVTAIRHGLDGSGYQHIPILSYAVKYSSSFYGPFREAANGAPQFGDRSSYQMDPANSLEALREAECDINEGADMLMVKPAMSYLDIVYRIKSTYPQLPLGAYQVSGEYAMIKAAAEKGWLNEKKTALESLLSIKRAGADFILTYFAKDAARWLDK